MNGDDLLLRLLLGGGLSLLVSALATAMAAALALGVGALDAWLRLMHGGQGGAAPYSAPLILLGLAAALGRSWMGDGVWLPLLAGTIAWLNLAWVVQREVRALHGRAFIDAARLAGLAPGRIVARHVVPHLWRPVAVRAALTLPQVMLGETLLSFAGFGLSESWGALLAGLVH